MATGTYAPDPDLHIVDANGVPVPGGLVWTYIAGTLTPTPTYTDVNLLVPNTNPIVAGSDGRFVAFLAGGISYKFVYEMPAVPPAHGANITTRDNILAVTSIAAGSGGGITQIMYLTGTVNDFALIPGCSVLYCANTSPVTFTGFSGGVAGQRLTIVALNSPVNFLYQSSGSQPVNRLVNFVSSGPTPIATSGATYGSATYIYNGSYSNWEIVAHEQGAWIEVPFNAANFSVAVGTWTVVAGNVVTYAYRLMGRTLTVRLNVGGTTVTGSPGALVITLPNGYTVVTDVQTFARTIDAGATVGMAIVAGAGINVFTGAGGSGWTAGTGRQLEVVKIIEVT